MIGYGFATLEAPLVWCLGARGSPEPQLVAVDIWAFKNSDPSILAGAAIFALAESLSS